MLEPDNARGPHPADGAALQSNHSGSGIDNRSVAEADPEAVAHALVGRFGPAWCRRLGAELDQAVADLLAERRTVWGG